MVAAAKEWEDKGPRTPEKRDQPRESQGQLTSARNAEIHFQKLQPTCTVTNPCSEILITRLWDLDAQGNGLACEIVVVISQNISNKVSYVCICNI